MSAGPSAEDQAMLHFIPFPPIEQLAVVGDRRSSATIAADGTVCWMCLPRFDAKPLFGCLLDLDTGGFWAFGPEDREFGVQRYLPGTAVLETRWEDLDSVLEATDCMLWPEDARPPGRENRRVLLRRLRCVSGRRTVAMRIAPREDYGQPASAHALGETVRLQTPSFDVGIWCSTPMQVLPDRTGAHFEIVLEAGEEIWAVFDAAGQAGEWNAAKAKRALDSVVAFWRTWSAQLRCTGERAEAIRLSGIVAYLFTYAPTGAVIAAPTTSLPERVPGEYNYDYRYCWIRDGALSISFLVELGVIEPAARFLDWIVGNLEPETSDPSKLPLQVLYRIDGGAVIPSTKRHDVSGYRNCQPVQFGNPVYQMQEIDGFGYLADLALMFAQHGGTVTDDHWAMLCRCADFVADNWEKPTAGIWELVPLQHFVISKVLCWVVFDRMLQLAAATGRKPRPGWRKQRSRIHAETLKKGWNDDIDSFVQRYDSDALDGALLLIPLLGFLPPDDDRVLATIERVSSVLRLNGLVHRFIPYKTPGRTDEPMGDKEGAFMMCTFWLAQAWHLVGRTELAEATLRRGERSRGTSGLFSEAGDARQTPGMLGNTPLLFSQVEYARAARALADGK